ncbi:hypothetical protein [Pseudoramibacter alactolyticus]
MIAVIRIILICFIIDASRLLAITAAAGRRAVKAPKKCNRKMPGPSPQSESPGILDCVFWTRWNRGTKWLALLMAVLAKSTGNKRQQCCKS